MRVLVSGSRDWQEAFAIWTFLDGLEAREDLAGEPLIVIQGGAKGADRVAAEWTWVRSDHSNHPEFKADWNKHGKAAGPIRNQQMLDEGKPDLVLAFKDNFNWKLDKGGTEDMVKRAKAAGVPTYVISRA